MSKDTKIIKNPMRGQSAPFQSYIPQYQLRGITPLSGSSTTQPMSEPKKILNPKATTQQSNVPYAEEAEISFSGILPNVGNNIENTWSGMDNFTLDEEDNLLQYDQDRVMVDNNYSTKEDNSVSSPTVSMEDDTITVLDASQLKIEYDEYVLVINGEVFSTGKMEQIESEVQQLVFNEHPKMKTNIVSPDDIVVLKRVKIKIGVFIE